MANKFQAELEAKRARLAEAEKEADVAADAAVSARTALDLVLDEGEAVALAARERVSVNLASALNLEQERLKAEISDLERRILAEHAAALAAEVEGQKSAAVEALWQAFEKVQALSQTELSARVAKAELTGDPYQSSGGYGEIATHLGQALEAFGEGAWTVDARTRRQTFRRFHRG